MYLLEFHVFKKHTSGDFENFVESFSYYLTIATSDTFPVKDESTDLGLPLLISSISLFRNRARASGCT